MTDRRILVITAFGLLALASSLLANVQGELRLSRRPFAASQTENRRRVAGGLQVNSLCDRSEHIIFNCRVKGRSQKAPIKIASLCASSDLDNERGYLQYRFGLPQKIELEFPQTRTGTQQMFQYTHYFRYQVDLTEINFQIDGYQYQIFDDYNGEEKPSISSAGVSVTLPGKEKEASLTCLGRVKADYGSLQDVLHGVE